MLKLDRGSINLYWNAEFQYQLENCHHTSTILLPGRHHNDTTHLFLNSSPPGTVSSPLPKATSCPPPILGLGSASGRQSVRSLAARGSTWENICPNERKYFIQKVLQLHLVAAGVCPLLEAGTELLVRVGHAELQRAARTGHAGQPRQQGALPRTAGFFIITDLH